MFKAGVLNHFRLMEHFGAKKSFAEQDLKNSVRVIAFLAICKRLPQAQAGSCTNRPGPAQPTHVSSHRLRPAQHRPRTAWTVKYYFYFKV